VHCHDLNRFAKTLLPQGWKASFILVAVSWFSGVLHLQAADSPFSTSARSTARVVVVSDPHATITFRAQPERVRALVEKGIRSYTGKTTTAEAWRSVLWKDGSPDSKDVVGIKVYSVPGPYSGTRPEVVEGVIEGLKAAGLQARQIVIWDKQITDLRLAGYFELAERLGVSVAASAQSGYDTNLFYESSLLGNLVWGDSEFGLRGNGLGRRSYVTRLASQRLTKIITVSPLLNHNQAGVSGCLYSVAFGSADNTARFDSSPDLFSDAIPDIYNLLADKVVMNIVDALISQYEGNERGLLHYSRPLNELWFSKDPVALDVLAIDELARQRNDMSAPRVRSNLDPYNKAALVEIGISDRKRIQVDRVK
jgi:hypothetical protein